MAKLTEEQWRQVFRIRCRSKSGQEVSQEAIRFCERAMKEDPTRYSEMDIDVLNATRPFGAMPIAKPKPRRRRL